jgi:hypothetical protein
MYTADKATHLRVVVSALLASIAIVTTTLTARLTHLEMDVQKVTTHTVYEPRSGRALTEIVQRERHPI